MENSEKIATIGIHAYNSKDFIRSTIESALSQTFKDFELIISDDASIDGTESICRDYASKDSRIRYIRHDKNIGGHNNANFVLQEAQGKYFTWLGHDDMLENTFLEETISYLSEHKECIVVSGDFQIIDELNRTIRIDSLDKVRASIKWEKRRLEFFKYPISKTFFCFYGLMRTEIVKNVFKHLPNQKKIMKGAEMPLLARLATRGEIASIPMVLRKYRQHSESAYNVEVSKLKKGSAIKKRLLLLQNLFIIRLDQIKVLLGSNYPLSQKVAILFIIYFGYAQSFLYRPMRFLIKILNRS